MRPTIKMIAELSGVSRGTVDRVLNNRDKVHPDKKARVLKVIRDLDYKPNLAARALVANRKSLRLGMVLPSWGGHFEDEVRRGLDDARKEMLVYGVDVLVEQSRSDSPDDFVACIEKVMKENIRGLAVCTLDSRMVRDRIGEAASAGIPVVTFNSDLPDSGRRSFVGQDLRQSGRIAASLIAKLVPRQKRVLVAAGNMEFAAHRQRVEGFADSMRRRGRDDAGREIIETYNDYTITLEKITAALEDRDIGGIYMANESVAACVDAVRQSRRRGIRIVAHDLSTTNIRILKDGGIDFLISQNLYLQGFKPIEILTRLLTDATAVAPEYNYTRIEVITDELVDNIVVDK